MNTATTQTAHLRHIGDVKPLSTSRDDINIFIQHPTFLYFGFFKHISDHFITFFKNNSKVHSICITNDKKARSDRNIYFLKVSPKELIYEEEEDNKLLRFVYLLEEDEIKINQSIVYNPQTKQKLMRKLQMVGEDIQSNQAFVFESQ